MREVRYEIMRVKELIAEAALGAAVVDDELAEAWLFFEEEAAEDSASLEASTRPRRRSGTSACEGRTRSSRARCTRSSTSDARAPRTPRRRDAPRGGRAGGARPRRRATRARRARIRRGRARAEDESLAQLPHRLGARRRHVRAPPVMDVPMLPMSEAEARLRGERTSAASSTSSPCASRRRRRRARAPRRTRAARWPRRTSAG